MTRTLVISDLHLGSRSGRDVLRAPVPLARLLAAVDRADRLVLLGDTVELSEARPRESMPLADPVLRAVGDAAGPGREIVLVPGNHDRLLVRSWLRAPGRTLGLDSAVPPHAGPLLERVVGALASGGATVTVRYPGVWLAERVWATHGHYLDRHLLPEGAFGVARGLLGRLPRDGAAPMDYEQRVSLTALEGPLTRWLPRGALGWVDDVLAAARRRSMVTASLASMPDSVLLARWRSHVLGVQMRRAAIPALARVVHRLGVADRADTVIFGHVHRVGPRDDDDPAQWSGPGGTPRIVNTGCWVHERLLLHRADPTHRYWPGGVAWVEGDEVAAGALLDDVPAEQLRVP